MHEIRKIELLAPAGSLDAARAAVNAGADAIYMGGPLFSARAYAESSEQDMLRAAMDLCHLRGVKVYMTLNTLMKQRELEGLSDYLDPYVKQGIDAIIVQDLGLLFWLRDRYPELPLHASTQMAVTGPYMARMLRDHGVERVVPARELSLSEISSIAGIEGLSVEVFAHGALCYCYSGLCLMSSVIGGRSGNRGRCAGPCRLEYDGKKLLSMKDMCSLGSLPELYQAGVSSLKIEGRMKSPTYVAGVTSVYRKYLDRLYELISEGGLKDGLRPEKADLRLLSEVFDRGGSTEGYLYRQNGRDMLSLGERPRLRIRDEEIIAEIEKKYLETDKSVESTCELYLVPGTRPRLRIRCTEAGAEALVEGETPVEAARSRPLSDEDIADRLRRTGGTGFVIRDVSIKKTGDIFMSVAELNGLRRRGIDELRKNILAGFRRDL